MLLIWVLNGKYYLLEFSKSHCTGTENTWIELKEWMGDGKRGKDILVENNVEIIISFQEERTNITKN